MELTNEHCLHCEDRYRCHDTCEDVENDLQRFHIAQRELPLSSLSKEQRHYAENSTQLPWKNYTADYYKYKDVVTNCNLTNRQSDILFMYMCEGLTQAEISREKNVSRQSINGIFDRIIEKLEKS